MSSFYEMTSLLEFSRRGNQIAPVTPTLQKQYYHITAKGSLHGSGINVCEPIASCTDIVEITDCVTDGTADLAVLTRDGELRLASNNRLLFSGVATLEGSNANSYVIRFQDGRRLDRCGMKEYATLFTRVMAETADVDYWTVGSQELAGYVRNGTAVLVFNGDIDDIPTIHPLVSVVPNSSFSHGGCLFQLTVPGTDYMWCSQTSDQAIYFYRKDGVVVVIHAESFIYSSLERLNSIPHEVLKAPAAIVQVYGIQSETRVEWHLALLADGSLWDSRTPAQTQQLASRVVALRVVKQEGLARTVGAQASGTELDENYYLALLETGEMVGPVVV
jgi:hypothetical protein